MTATDELRKLLDERGVEYEKGCYVLDVTRQRAIETAWVDNNCRYEFTEYPAGSTRLDVYNIKPEQAIVATLGSEREKELIALVLEMRNDMYQTMCDMFTDSGWVAPLGTAYDKRIAALEIEVVDK